MDKKLRETNYLCEKITYMGDLVTCCKFGLNVMLIISNINKCRQREYRF